MYYERDDVTIARALADYIVRNDMLDYRKLYKLLWQGKVEDAREEIISVIFNLAKVKGVYDKIKTLDKINKKIISNEVFNSILDKEKYFNIVLRGVV